MAASDKQEDAVSSTEKIARLLALLALKDVEAQTDKVMLLKSAGFSIKEAALMLGVQENTVSVALYQAKKNKKKPKK